MHPDLTTKDIARFWSKVDRSGGPAACWPWTATLSTAGYGQFRLRHTNASAHRVAYLVIHGAIPADRPHVLHTCDNRPCCNPAHLFAGTALDNMRDKVAKGRQARGERQGTHTHPETVKHGDEHYARQHPELVVHGEAHHKAKLNPDAVRAIRARYAAGESQTVLSREFGVARHSIKQVALRKSWKHID